MSIKKLSKEEIQTLQDYQVKNNEIVGGLGTIELRIESLKKNKKSLLEEFEKLQKDQLDTGNQLQEKYGEGNIDLEKGEFTPIA
mgnify:CR=1 FL=1|jgi:hypothetical protein